MNRSEILSAANICITKDRAATHGEAENNFAAIAGGWNWWLSIRQEGKLTAHDVAMMMSIFKTARAANNKNHIDNYIDNAGYQALAAEIAIKPTELAIPHPDAGDRLLPAFQSVRNKHVTPSKSHAL
jgi:hypothetical protein